MKAILTKYHGPTRSKPARISATDGDGNRVTISADDDGHVPATRHENSHKRAARAFCKKLDWHGELVMGSVPGGYVFVFVEQKEMVTV